jgi:hypothetical protein
VAVFAGQQPDHRLARPCSVRNRICSAWVVSRFPQVPYGGDFCGQALLGALESRPVVLQGLCQRTVRSALIHFLWPSRTEPRQWRVGEPVGERQGVRGNADDRDAGHRLAPDQSTALRLVVLADRLYAVEVPVLASGLLFGPAVQRGGIEGRLPQEGHPGNLPADGADLDAQRLVELVSGPRAGNFSTSRASSHTHDTPFRLSSGRNLKLTLQMILQGYSVSWLIID